jgi:hypothetical protein
MGIRDNLGRFFQRLGKQVTGSYWTDSFTGGRGKTGERVGDHFRARWSYAPKRNQIDWLEAFHTNPRLDSVDMIATDIASTPFKLYKKAEFLKSPKTAEPIVSHPFYDFWENPMPQLSEHDGWYLRYLTEVYMDLIGEGFWWLGRKNTKGAPVEAYALPSIWVLWTPTVNRNVFSVMPMGNVSLRQVDVDPLDMVWFKNPDITKPYGRGRGRSEAVGDELEADEFAAKYQKNLFYNDAIPPLLIGLIGAGDQQVEAFAEQWITRYGGYKKARKPAFVGFDPKVNKLVESPREMDMTESRRYLRDACKEHYGVPPELFGILENSNRSTIDSAYYLYAKKVLKPRLDRRASMYNRQVVPLWGDDIIGAFDNVVPEDEETLIKKMGDGMAKGAVMLDEYRQALGLENLPGKKGKVFLRPISLVVVPLADVDKPPEPTVPPAGEQPEAKPAEEDEEEAASAPGEEPEEKPPAKAITKAVLSAEQKAAHWKVMDTTATSLEPVFMASVRSFAGIQQKKLKEMIRKNGENGLSAAAAAMRALDDVFTQKSDEKLIEKLTAAWIEAIKAGWDKGKDLLGTKAISDVLEKRERPASGETEFEFGTYQDIFMQKIRRRGLAAAKNINETTRERLRASLEEGIAAGEDQRHLQDRVKAEYESLDGAEASAWRALTIARTESMSSMNEGSLLLYASEGVPKKGWLSTLDDRARGANEKDQTDHISLHEKEIPIEEPFVEPRTGKQLMFPGDPDGGPENICNCRCTLYPVIE